MTARMQHEQDAYDAQDRANQDHRAARQREHQHGVAQANAPETIPATGRHHKAG